MRHQGSADGPKGARGSARAAPSGAPLWSVGLCGRRYEGPQLMRKSLGGVSLNP
jgi:hypothetical protein